MRRVLPLLALLLAPSTAVAQIDEGCTTFTSVSQSGFAYPAWVFTNRTTNGWMHERWVMATSHAISDQATLRSAAPRRAPEAPFVAWTYSYQYEVDRGAAAGALARVSDAWGDGADVSAARVTVEGGTEGWRFRVHDAARVDELWVLAPDYSPPRPVGARAGLALDRGWSFPYTSDFSIAAAPVERLLDEAAETIEDKGWLMARGSYTVRPASPADMARCGM